MHGRKLRLGCRECRGGTPSASATLAICIPMRSSMTRETAQALKTNMDGVRFDLLTTVGKDVVTARKELAARALEKGAPFVLWADSDAWWRPGTLRRMLSVMKRHDNIDLLAGAFGGRDHYSPVFAWRSASDQDSFPKVGLDCGPTDIVLFKFAASILCFTGSKSCAVCRPTCSAD